MLHKHSQQGPLGKVHVKVICLLILLSHIWVKSIPQTKTYDRRSCMNLLKKVVDVVGDGHCGFRVVAGLGNISLVR